MRQFSSDQITCPLLAQGSKGKLVRVEALRTHDQTCVSYPVQKAHSEASQATNLLPSLQISLDVITLLGRSEASLAATTQRRLQLLLLDHENIADLGSGSTGEVRPLNGDSQ
jgi:hypothetical protein